MTLSPFQSAVARCARIRRGAYDRTISDALEQGLAGPSLRLTDIDAETLLAWKRTWRGTRAPGAGGWDWETLWKRFRRRPTALQLAIWDGDELCGLALGRVSRRRALGVRHTVSVHYMEASPEPEHPLAGLIAALVIAAAERYGEALGASRLRLMDPLPGLMGYYRKLGFTIALLPGRRVYFEKRIPQ